MTRRDPLDPGSGTGGILPESDNCAGCRFTLQCHSGRLQADCGLRTFLCVSCGDFVVLQLGDGRILAKFKCHMRPADAETISRWRQRAWGGARHGRPITDMNYLISDPGPPQRGMPNLLLKLCEECRTYWTKKRERRWEEEGKDEV